MGVDLTFLSGEPSIPMIAILMATAAVATNLGTDKAGRLILMALHVAGLAVLTVLFPWEGAMGGIPLSTLLLWTLGPYLMTHLAWWGAGLALRLPR